MERAFAVSFIFLFSIGVAVLFLRIKIERHLERNQPLLWDELGRPKLIGVASHHEKNNRFVEYFSNKHYLELNDPGLNRLAFTANIVSKAGLALTLVTVVLGVAIWAFV